MNKPFRREGDLKSLSSYPQWLQEIVRSTDRDRYRIANSEFFRLMRDARLPRAALQKFLIHNIRVEQKHADLWVDWARAAGLTLADLKAGGDTEVPDTLPHWCWYVCDTGSLAAAIAATNYAIEGLTGDWSCLVCSDTAYAESIPEAHRVRAMRWLRVHAHYDDAHPWEALDIVATLLGQHPPASEVASVRRAIRASYIYFEMGLSYPMAELAHGTFDETASNASTLGALDAA